MITRFTVFKIPALAIALLTTCPAATKAEFNIRNVASGLLLDVQGGLTNDFQPVILFRRNNMKHQLFDMNLEVDDSFSLSVRHSFKCLDVINSGTGNGVRVVQFRCHFGANQRWKLQRMGNGVILRSVHSGKCLDAGNSNFPTPPRETAVLQQWTCISRASDANAVNQIFQLGGF
jgi:hypothetical protein